MFTKAEEIIQLIEGRKNRGYGLMHFKDYMKSIGDPQKKLKSIHVAGTNGKGSTTNDIRSMLQEAGYCVGSFTSPYMITHLDRIRINDMYMDEKEFIEIANTYYESWLTWDLSMFEIDMMLACIYFERHHVDYAVFEVGLGGRKDATNILEPLISVITNIGLDHMELLGDTYAKIAEEKAGIIKACADVVSAETRADCLDVFLKHADAQGVKLYTLEPICDLSTNLQTVFTYRHLQVTLASMANYQIRNAALALETIWRLREKRLVEIKDAQILAGLRKAVWIGRFEIMQKDPIVILDGAHNPDGIQALCNSLQSYDDIAVLFSVLKDKNFETMLSILETITSDITITHFDNERSLDIRCLKNRKQLHLIEDYHAALTYMLKKKKTIVITGSLYFISEIRQFWQK
ncbi:bifunctional folylpolyglutamate synthase/dihydrofolate synthase [Eubacterium sp. AF18-3]|nr:bifunctional folylpolyglutamate synthase/dihydrofolate synthase [Eubacterium sp. AF18-3]